MNEPGFIELAGGYRIPDDKYTDGERLIGELVGVFPEADDAIDEIHVWANMTSLLSTHIGGIARDTMDPTDRYDAARARAYRDVAMILAVAADQISELAANANFRQSPAASAKP